MLCGVFGGKNEKWHLVDGSNHATGLIAGAISRPKTAQVSQIAW